ncbi:MAG: trypsin-like serine protease [Planctomycetota bacterium]
MPSPKIVFALLAFFACSLFAGSDVIGIAPRIIDGSNVPASTYPTVGIITNSPSTFICSGTLIAPRFVLTAAHCSVSGSTGALSIGQTNGRFIIGGSTYKTAHIYVHPTYKGDRSQDVEGAIDLCIFELTQDVPNVVPSPLFRQVPTVGTLLRLVGYGEQGTGKTGANGTLPPNGTVNTGTSPIDIVTNTFIKWNFTNTTPKESNTAPGDSGGPQFIMQNGMLLLASVTSGGLNSNAAFGDQSYNTRVDIATPWIDSITGGTPVPGNNAPQISSSMFSPNPAMSGQQVTFTVSASDADNDTLNYHWIFGDGTEKQNGATSEMHTYVLDGTYLVQLIVSDNKGGTAVQDFSVTSGNGNVTVVPTLILKKRFTLNFATPERSSLDFTLTRSAFIFKDQASYLSAYDMTMANVYLGSMKIDSMMLTGTKGVGIGTLLFSYRTGSVRYTVKNNAQLNSVLSLYGATNATTPGPISVVVPLRIELSSVLYGNNAVFSYAARMDKIGNGR